MKMFGIISANEYRSNKSVETQITSKQRTGLIDLCFSVRGRLLALCQIATASIILSNPHYDLAIYPSKYLGLNASNVRDCPAW